MPPQVVLGAERDLARVMRAAAAEGLLTSAHDLSEGGLAVALVESALQGGLGFAVTLPDADPTVALFSESGARAVVSLSGEQLGRFESLCAEHSVPATRIGEVTADGTAEFVGLFTVGLDEVREAWRSPIRAALEG